MDKLPERLLFAINPDGQIYEMNGKLVFLNLIRISFAGVLWGIVFMIVLFLNGITLFSFSNLIAPVVNIIVWIVFYLIFLPIDLMRAPSGILFLIRYINRIIVVCVTLLFLCPADPLIWIIYKLNTKGFCNFFGIDGYYFIVFRYVLSEEGYE